MIDNFDLKLETLLHWVKNTDDEKKISNHTYISPKIDVKDVRSSGRGIYAVEPLKKGELILNIPHSFLLNFTTVMAHIAKYNGMAIDLHIHVPFDKSIHRNISYIDKGRDSGTLIISVTIVVLDF